MQIAKFIPGTVSNTVRRDLKRLDQVEAGLGDKALAYVSQGKEETVLSTIATKAKGNPLEIIRRAYSSSDDKSTQNRQTFFLDADPFDVMLLGRYAEVLAISCNPLPDGLLGSDAVPPAFRVYFSEAVLGARDPRSYWPVRARERPIKGLTADTIIPCAEAMGASAADVFELLYWSASAYSYLDSEVFRKQIDLETLLTKHNSAALEGIARTSAPGRVDFLTDLNKMGLTAEEPYLSAALDYAGDSAKSVRAAALSALRSVPPTSLEVKACERLSKGTVAMRDGMVLLLSGLGTESANAALAAHVKTEKTARIKAAIENALSVVDAGTGNDAIPDDASGYTAIDGSRVDIPAMKPLSTGARVPLSDADHAKLRERVEAHNKKTEEWNKENKGKPYFHKQRMISGSVVDDLTKLLSGRKLKQTNRWDVLRVATHFGEDIVRAHMAKQPQDMMLNIAFGSLHSISHWFSPYSAGAFAGVFQDYLSSPDADFRAIEALWCEAEFEVEVGGWRNHETRPARKGDMLRCMIPEDSYRGSDPLEVPGAALWPYLAENFDLLDHAFGAGTGHDVALDRVRAVSCISILPKVPARFLGPLLDIATGERKAGKIEARKLLSDVPEVDDRLIALLDDSRQAVRAGAAEWLGNRGNADAVPSLRKRLKKEKSELAKAAILTCLQTLGDPLDDFVGPTALIREAETGLKKAKFDKLAWMQFDSMPVLKFRNGKAVPKNVPRWWIYLAFKLKQPGGNALFDIYLDQLLPDSAEAFSNWVFDSWVSYDTTVPSDEEANAYAEQHADSNYAVMKRWIEGYTRDAAFASLRRQKKSEYLHSGTASKGILAFASRASAHSTADRVRAYLRNHGSRTSQASSLLDVLAHKGDPVSLQVVISAATRLKQKGVQAYAGTLVEAVAERMNWSMHELGDRVIPTAGLDDSGVLELPCGPDEKIYTATLSEDYTFVLKNPDGKLIKSLPAGKDDATKAARKQFTASKKELKQIVSMQSARLYEALCGARVWDVADWQRDFRDHPVMRRLTERIVWQGLDEAGDSQICFRPTAEGEYTDAEDNPIEPENFSQVRVAHGTMLDSATVEAWDTHLKDYEIKPLFQQFGRSLKRIDDTQEAQTLIEDRKGWVLESFQLRGIATKLGYERGQAEDGGWFYVYQKPFTGVGLTAVIEFTGNMLPEENRSVGLLSLSFVDQKKRMPQALKLGDVPQVLLSECWNDFHDMAAKATFDPNWEKICEW